jgi:formylglycine-generating enzyme required for sulfatase activity
MNRMAGQFVVAVGLAAGVGGLLLLGTGSVGQDSVPDRAATPAGAPANGGLLTDLRDAAWKWTVTSVKMVLEREAERDRYRQANAALLAGELTLSIKPNVEFRFVYLPPGRFKLGYSDEDRLRLAAKTANTLAGSNAQPQVNVVVAHGYFILDREVTEAQLAASKDKEARGDLPARDVTWDEAMAFCDWLSRQSGYQVRLPTEIEWEYAARGPWSQRYPWANPAEFHARAVKDNDADRPDGPRGFDKDGGDVSWRGVHDLAGNVSEWCLDVYKDRAYRDLDADKPYHPEKVRPELPPAGKVFARTYRGGAFKDSPLNCEAPVRRSWLQDERSPVIGFRPVLILEGLPPPPQGDER